jgi:hypothetical protein
MLGLLGGCGFGVFLLIIVFIVILDGTIIITIP